MQSATAPAGLHINLLGSLTADRDGAELDLGGRRQRAVIAMLALARGSIVPAERLIDSLWGEAPPPSAAGALQAYVSHLRRRLEPEGTARSRGNVIASVSAGYSIRLDDDAIDAWRFDRLFRDATAGGAPRQRIDLLTQALGLWRGPALADYLGESWAQADAARLTEQREVAREHLLAARLEGGETDVLVPLLEEAIAHEPLREERWRLLTLALYRCGRQGDALAALQRARRTLADELGVDPGPTLRALETEILAQSPDLVPTGEARAERVALPPRAPTVARSTSTRDNKLLDRDRELTELRACLTDALDGSARLALIDGPAGIGKSRLLAEVRRLATERGALVLAARGSQLEKEYAFGAVRQLFESTVASSGDRATLLTGAAASSVSVFGAEPTEPQARADGSFAVLHGLYWLTVNLSSRQPLVLLVDDLQWCDTGSLRFLAYLIRRLEGIPVLLVATLRTGESYDDDALLDELAHDQATVPVRPSPLTIDGVAELVRQGLGEPADAFVAACHRTTSGNPLLLRQLIRALQAEGVVPSVANADAVTVIGSRAVSSLVLTRLARLSPATRTVARAIAVLGDGAALPVVAGLAELSEVEVGSAIAALARIEVLRNDHPLGFVHPLVADAVYRDLAPTQRQLHHERAARLLSDSGAAAQQVAAHLLQVPYRGDQWVVTVLRQAAQVAADRGAADVAATYLRRAVAEPPVDPGEVLLELGLLEAHANGASAIEHLRAAYNAVTDARSRAEAATVLVHTLIFAGQLGEATEMAHQILANPPHEDLDAQQGLHALARIGGYMHGLEPSVWQVGSPQVEGSGPGARMLAAALSWDAMIAGEDRERAISLARFAIADKVLTEFDPGLLWVVAANVLNLADADVGTFWDDSLATAHARGSLFSALAVHLWRGYAQFCHGELREALHSFTTATDLMLVWGPSIAHVYAQTFTIQALAHLGRVAEARAMLEQSRDVPRVSDPQRLYWESEIVVLLAEGRPSEVVPIADRIAGSQTYIANPAWRSWRSWRALGLAGAGRVEEAITAADEDLLAARRWGAPTRIGAALRLAGDLRGPAGVELLQEAVEVLAPTAARLEYARALHALARHSGNSAVAPLLTEAYQIANRCGAAPLVAAISACMAEAGLQVPAEPPPVATLTTTERRIAAMSADGADEREIAQALFLTPRTVQRALDALRIALNAQTRGDLRRALVTGL